MTVPVDHFHCPFEFYVGTKINSFAKLSENCACFLEVSCNLWNGNNLTWDINQDTISKSHSRNSICFLHFNHLRNVVSIWVTLAQVWVSGAQWHCWLKYCSGLISPLHSVSFFRVHFGDDDHEMLVSWEVNLAKLTSHETFSCPFLTKMLTLD